MTAGKLYLIAGVLCLALLGSVTYYLYQEELTYKQMLSRCSDYEGWELDILDCYGEVSLINTRQAGQPTLTIFGHNNNYEFALIDSDKNFIVVGKYLYVIARKQDAPYFTASKIVNGSEQINKGYYWPFLTSNIAYETEANIPNLLKIEYSTGIVTPYLNYDEMAAEDRAIFHELEARIAQK